MKARTLTATAALIAAFLSAAADADVIIDFTEEGSDVVARASGTLNLDSFSYGGSWQPSSGVGAYTSFVGFVTPGGYNWGADPSLYFGYSFWGQMSGPANFGGGDFIEPTRVTGDLFAFWAPDLIVVSFYFSGYVENTATWENATLSSLGLDPGTYVYTWGSGDSADSLTINIKSAAVPEPSSLAMAGLAAGLGLIAARRRIAGRALANV